MIFTIKLFPAQARRGRGESNLKAVVSSLTMCCTSCGFHISRLIDFKENVTGISFGVHVRSILLCRLLLSDSASLQYRRLNWTSWWRTNDDVEGQYAVFTSTIRTHLPMLMEEKAFFLLCLYILDKINSLWQRNCRSLTTIIKKTAQSYIKYHYASVLKLYYTAVHIPKSCLLQSPFPCFQLVFGWCLTSHCLFINLLMYWPLTLIYCSNMSLEETSDPQTLCCLLHTKLWQSPAAKLPSAVLDPVSGTASLFIWGQQHRTKCLNPHWKFTL